MMTGTRKTLFFALLVVVAGGPAAAQTQSDESIVIPLRVDGGRLLVPVEAPDGAEFEFVLSLGNPTVLSESTAARLGDHPHIMPIFDLGEEAGQPYLVQPLMAGGDVEALIGDAGLARPSPNWQGVLVDRRRRRRRWHRGPQGIRRRDPRPRAGG